MCMQLKDTMVIWCGSVAVRNRNILRNWSSNRNLHVTLRFDSLCHCRGNCFTIQRAHATTMTIICTKQKGEEFKREIQLFSWKLLF